MAKKLVCTSCGGPVRKPERFPPLSGQNSQGLGKFYCVSRCKKNIKVKVSKYAASA